jgi:hypothetical protein
MSDNLKSGSGDVDGARWLLRELQSGESRAVGQRDGTHGSEGVSLEGIGRVLGSELGLELLLLGVEHANDDVLGGLRESMECGQVFGWDEVVPNTARIAGGLGHDGRRGRGRGNSPVEA